MATTGGGGGWDCDGAISSLADDFTDRGPPTSGLCCVISGDAGCELVMKSLSLMGGLPEAMLGDAGAESEPDDATDTIHWTGDSAWVMVGAGDGKFINSTITEGKKCKNTSASRWWHNRNFTSVDWLIDWVQYYSVTQWCNWLIDWVQYYSVTQWCDWLIDLLEY